MDVFLQRAKGHAHNMGLQIPVWFFSLSLHIPAGMQQCWNHVHKAFMLATKNESDGVLIPALQTNRKSICPLKKKAAVLRFPCSQRTEEPMRKWFAERQHRARDLRKQTNLHPGEVETWARSAIYFITSGINWQLSHVSGKIQSYSF